MIIKVEFLELGGLVTVLFGDSYKSWEEQYAEYRRIFTCEPVNAWKSNAKWKGWGGLKWCEEKDFQHELNREGVQNGEPDNTNPRQYSEMVFEVMSLDKLPRK